VHPGLTAARAQAHIDDLHRTAAAARRAPGRPRHVRVSPRPRGLVMSARLARTLRVAR
jgi:hypothetical protein